MKNNELHNAFKEFISKAKEKGYRQEHIKTLGMFALTKKAVEHFGSSLVAFEHLITLVDKYEEDDVIKLYIEELKI